MVVACRKLLVHTGEARELLNISPGTCKAVLHSVFTKAMSISIFL